MIIDFDENDGQFDHVPPVPVPGTTDEFYLETSLAPQPLPVGLGFRVPVLLISPWTRGGWVTSEVSDHTSVLQFLEKWTEALGKPAICPNISAWRHSVCGDLTGAFDFGNPVFGLPDLPDPGRPIGEPSQAYDPVPADNAMPAQEPGTKRARPLPYQRFGHGSATHLADPVASSQGWYDVSVTISGDSSWFRRYVGHLEDGKASITG